MARPRTTVTLENLYYIDHYFYRAIKDDRLYKESDDSFEKHSIAKQAFQRLPSINYTNTKLKKMSQEERCKALQKWVDKYISPERWQRCLMTLRQQKSKKKLKLQRLDLTLEIYLTVKRLAEKQGMTIGEAIYKVAKPALDKILAKALDECEGPLK